MNRKKIIQLITIRLVVFLLPLLWILYMANKSFEHNAQREHKVDAGLGVGLMFLVFIAYYLLFILFDLFFRIVKKQKTAMYVDIGFLIVIGLPILIFLIWMT